MTPPSTADMNGNSTPGTYSPESQDRRRGSRSSDDGPDARHWVWRLLKPTELLLGISLLVGALNLAGFHYQPTSMSLDAEIITRRQTDSSETRERNHTDSLLRLDLDRNTHRIDSLDNRLGFIAYLQCVQLRKTDPESLPAGCEPVIQRGARQ